MHYDRGPCPRDWRVSRRNSRYGIYKHSGEKGLRPKEGSNSRRRSQSSEAEDPSLREAHECLYRRRVYTPACPWIVEPSKKLTQKHRRARQHVRTLLYVEYSTVLGQKRGPLCVLIAIENAPTPKLRSDPRD